MSANIDLESILENHQRASQDGYRFSLLRMKRDVLEIFKGEVDSLFLNPVPCTAGGKDLRSLT